MNNTAGFISVREAMRVRGEEGRNPLHATRMWLWRWNKRHPYGDPLHIVRLHGAVHEESFRRALEANAQEQQQ